MIPIIERAIVDKKKWLQKDEFIEMLALVQSVPGPISINSSVFIGYKVKGLKGAIYAALGVVLPSFFIILLIAISFSEMSSNAVVERVFKGLRPAVVALIAAPIIRMIKSSGVSWKTAFIPILGALAIWQFSVSPIYVILIAACIGIIYNFWREK